MENNNTHCPGLLRGLLHACKMPSSRYESLCKYKRLYFPLQIWLESPFHVSPKVKCPKSLHCFVLKKMGKKPFVEHTVFFPRLLKKVL